MGKDDCSLQVENFPKAPPPGQVKLIPVDGDEMKGSQLTGDGKVGQEVK